MAIWQYSLQVIPRSPVCINDQLLARLEINHTEDGPSMQCLPSTEHFWQMINKESDPIVEEIDQLIKRDPAFTQDFYLWKGNTANDEDNDVFIDIDESKNILSFNCRIDLRKEVNIHHFLLRILYLCRANEFVLMDVHGRLFEPELTAILESIKSSNAFRFVENPQKFLDDFANGGFKN